MFDLDAGSLEDLGATLASADPRTGTDDDLFAAAITLEQLSSRIEAAKAHTYAELTARNACDHTYGLRTGAWVAREAATAPAATRIRARIGALLRDHLPEIDAAFGAGDLSWEHVRALATAANPRVLPILTAVQPAIIALAQGTGFERWRTQVQGLIELADQDGPHRPDPGTNQLWAVETIDGIVHLKGMLTRDLGLILRTALDAKTDELFRRATRDHAASPDLPVPSRPELTALALIELIRDATSTDPATRRPPRPEVTLIRFGDQLTDTHGRPVPAAAGRLWACDPDQLNVRVDPFGVPLDLGHTHRLATAAQRRAIALRDGGCVFPGCDAPVNWLDAHHLHHWDHGGPTDLVNLASR